MLELKWDHYIHCCLTESCIYTKNIHVVVVYRDDLLLILIMMTVFLETIAKYLSGTRQPTCFFQPVGGDQKAVMMGFLFVGFYKPFLYAFQ